ncbi:YjdF family protein [Paenibacillus sp. ISL-20]|uniref:YjdF family protein n=1 Tax=Paenibacillus sp. ISL-20 TaxID=2819163 RepID=UPI001BECCA76|nr:YjdF family protein [Paenibacillus sp. ISL-20]MBT2760377.1 YjdF family protein [Paenibacillus sp. ISL-20]
MRLFVLSEQVLVPKEQGRLKACRHFFGNEPKDPEILEFVSEKMMNLTKVGTDAKGSKNTRVNPKRLARQASQEIAERGLSSHAQEAIKLDLESRKLQQKVHNRQQILEENERKYQLRVQKAKKKHRGK